ncbi:MAG: glycosyltransferase family 4 protein, partial [Chloroflexota bacterium]
MRIGWIVPGYQGREDEPGIPALTGLARELARDHDLRVYAVRFPLRNQEYSVDGVSVIGFGTAPAMGNRFQWRAGSVVRWTRVLRALHVAHRRAPFAVLHGFWATEAGMLAAVGGRLLGVPVAVSVCGGEFASVRSVGYGNQLNRFERAQVALSLHLADRIGVGSDDTRSRLIARYPLLEARIVNLPLGFDPMLFTPAPATAPPGTLVCVASWSAVKGHALLLDAMRLLRAWGSPVRLTLIGERTDSAEARRAVAERGLEDWVDLLGYQSQARVAEVLGRARVSAMASWHEAQCLAIVESLARGIPVVATPVG